MIARGDAIPELRGRCSDPDSVLGGAVGVRMERGVFRYSCRTPMCIDLVVPLSYIVVVVNQRTLAIAYQY